MSDTIIAPTAPHATRLEPIQLEPIRRIVIAVDGSPASVDALRWAKTHLLEPTDRVRVVTAYHHTYYAAEVPITDLELRTMADGARLAAERAIRDVFGPGEPGGAIEHVVELARIDHLVERCGDDAAFIVLGSRSRRRLRDRLMPSATNRITGRVACPVISVPHTSAGASAGSGGPRSDHAR